MVIFNKPNGNSIYFWRKRRIYYVETVGKSDACHDGGGDVFSGMFRGDVRQGRENVPGAGV